MRPLIKGVTTEAAIPLYPECAHNYAPHSCPSQFAHNLTTLPVQSYPEIASFLHRPSGKSRDRGTDYNQRRHGHVLWDKNEDLCMLLHPVPMRPPLVPVSSGLLVWLNRKQRSWVNGLPVNTPAERFCGHR